MNYNAKKKQFVKGQTVRKIWYDVATARGNQ